MTIAQENAEAVMFARLVGEAEVGVEIALGGGEPGNGPAHALLVRLDVGERRAGHQNQRDVACMQM